jgi:hypothetical protein
MAAWGVGVGGEEMGGQGRVKSGPAVEIRVGPMPMAMPYADGMPSA